LKHWPTVEAPKPIHQVFPVYPHELRQKGVEGEVKLRLLIDENGDVKGVDVVKSLHPYLDYAATMAFLQWKFEPILRKGKPVRVTSVFTFIFSPEKYTLIDRSVLGGERSNEETDFATRNRLQSILDKCAEYCKKLDGSALDFVCEESIQETHQYLDFKKKSKEMTQIKEARGTNWYYGVFSKYRAKYSIRSVRNRYLCDYQLIKSGDRTEERRIILKEGRKIPTSPKQRLEEMRFSVLRPLFAAIQILGRDSQNMFDYSIVDEDEISGKKTYIIEAIPLYRNIGSLEKARIWVNKQNSQILKVVINGVPLVGYDDVWQDATMLGIKPESTITHIYKLERNGVMFPDRSSIFIEYPAVSFPDQSSIFIESPAVVPREPIVKVDIEMSYDKYKYFTVETEFEVIKKISIDLARPILNLTGHHHPHDLLPGF
ncbi:MAG: TonB family protein, partial [Desulfobacterales bacterium]|nr:TonB family protein [Desulfobacterales bacterium]